MAGAVGRNVCPFEIYPMPCGPVCMFYQQEKRANKLLYMFCLRTGERVEIARKDLRRYQQHAGASHERRLAFC